MKILIDITHPAYAHFFRTVVPRLVERGHELLITSRQKDVNCRLLDSFGFEHQCLSRAGSSKLGLIAEMLVRDWRLCRVARRFKPDLVLMRDGLYGCHVAWFMGVPSITFDDTDDAYFMHRLAFPFATRVYTDHAYSVRVPGKQRFYHGVSSVAYLHPDVFTPDRSVLEEAGVADEESIIICRLVSWTANHDGGHRGFDAAGLRTVLDRLSTHGRVLITSEKPLPDAIEPYRLAVPAERLPHLMAFADLYVGESATMAHESAILGVPAVHVSTRKPWYTELLEKEFDLVANADNMNDCLAACERTFIEPGFRDAYLQKRDRYLESADDLIEVVLRAVDEFAPNEALAGSSP